MCPAMCVLNMCPDVRPQCVGLLCGFLFPPCAFFLRSCACAQCASSMSVLNLCSWCASSMSVLNLCSRCASSMSVLNLCSWCASSMCVLNVCLQYTSARIVLKITSTVPLKKFTDGQILRFVFTVKQLNVKWLRAVQTTNVQNYLS